MMYVVMHVYYDKENYNTGYEPVAVSYSEESAKQFKAEAELEKNEYSSFEILTVPVV